MEENRSASSGASAKRTIAVTAAAVAVAAVLAGGVTYSYLVGASNEVENAFETNADPVVEVVETTGTDYEIVPGTSETKDPYVYVTTTTDYSYVFLIVQDNTYGLVDYTIADGWEVLYVYDSSGDGNDTDEDGNAYYYTKIYYRVVADTEGESVGLQVLKDDTVSYDEVITGEYMVDVLGNALDVTLSFGAVAIQCEGFEDAEGAFAAAYSSYTAAPLAFVYPIEPEEITLTNPSGITLTPDVIYVFEATESSTTAAYSYYADWVAEFVVTVDTSGADEDEVDAWNGYLAVAGQYGSYGWISLLLEDAGDEDATYYLMETLFGSGSDYSGIDYYELCGLVGKFTCGTIQEYTYGSYAIAVPDGVTITVELRLYESYDKSASSYSDTYVTIGSWSYTYGSDSDDEETDDTSTEDSSTSDSTTE